MLFSSFVFIFAFLPLVWGGFVALKNANFRLQIAGKILDNATLSKLFLIAASLYFYAFFKAEYVLILLFSMALNYLFAKTILGANERERERERENLRRSYL